MISSSLQTAGFHDLPQRAAPSPQAPQDPDVQRRANAAGEDINPSGRTDGQTGANESARAVPPTSAADGNTLFQTQEQAQKADKEKKKQDEPQAGKPGVLNEGQLSEGEQRQLDALKRRDAEVRRHEQAHRAAAGPHAGPAQYQYVTGPDGRQYAVSGEVSISTGDAPTPQATIAKLETIIRAALAPANPSGQDRAVAQSARQQITEIRGRIQAEKLKEAREEGTDDDASPAQPSTITSQQASDAYGQAQNTAQNAALGLIAEGNAAEAQIIFASSGSRTSQGIDLRA